MGLFSIAAKAETSGEYTYSIFRDKVTIKSVSSKISGDVTIPSTFGGYPVTYIGERAFEYCQKITSVVIPNTVVSIGDFAFYHCDKITSVQIPSSVTSIGAYSFIECSKLSSIIIPSSVTVLNNFTFAHCVSLERIEIPNGVTTIGDSVFSGCTSLNSITIPDTVTSIGQLAFYLTAYYDDSNNWENDLLYIDGHLVGVKSSNKSDCTVKPDTKTIAFSAFAGYKSLLNLTIPFVGGSESKNTHFGYLFGGKTDVNNKLSVLPNIEKINISNGCTKIPKYSFEECIFIEEVVIPDSVTTIEDSAFRGCSSLKSINIPSKLTSIADNAFGSCPLLTLNIDINNNQAINYAKRKNIKYTTFGTLTESSKPSSGNTSSNDTHVSHSMGEWITNKEPTCTTSGIKIRKCSICNYSESKPIEVLGHAFSNPSITKQPTCMETGVESGKCTRCGQSTTNTIKAKGHNFGSWSETKGATCTKGGTKERKCSNCDEIESRNTEALGHDFENPKIIKEATLSSTGLIEGKCKRCGETTSEVIPCGYTDSSTGITLEVNEGVFQEDTEIKIKVIKEEDTEFEKVKTALKEVSNKFIAYDISAICDNVVVHPNSTVTVSFKIPEGFGKNVAVFYISNEGISEKLESTISEDGKSISATLSHFSSYAVVELDAADTETNVDNATDENSSNTLWIIIAIISVVVIAGAVSTIILIKKKKLKQYNNF